LTRYGISITKLLNQAAPDGLIADLERRLHPALHGEVRIHVYPFGGIEKAAHWIRNSRPWFFDINPDAASTLAAVDVRGAQT
jgi:methylenetetrahydrofolate reductase (NADPH)